MTPLRQFCIEAAQAVGVIAIVMGLGAALFFLGTVIQ